MTEGNNWKSNTVGREIGFKYCSIFNELCVWHITLELQAIGQSAQIILIDT